MLYSWECAHKTNQEKMNTKHKHYKEYLKILTLDNKYHPENYRLNDKLENEYFDILHSPKYYRFNKINYRGGCFKVYKDKLNAQDKTKNKIALKRAISDSSYYDWRDWCVSNYPSFRVPSYIPPKNFIHSHRHSAMWYI